MKFVLSIEPKYGPFGKAWSWNLTKVGDTFEFHPEHDSYSGLSAGSGNAMTRWGARRAARKRAAEYVEMCVLHRPRHPRDLTIIEVSEADVLLAARAT